MAAGQDNEPLRRLWPQLDELVPPELPPDMAVARLAALARSLLIENRQLREVLAIAGPPESHALGADDAGFE
jgi:hypothetical protein